MIENESLKQKLKNKNYKDMTRDEKEYYNLFLRPLSVPKECKERLYNALLND